VRPRRRRLEKGKADAPCGLCGSEDVVVVELLAVRRGMDRLNPVFRQGVRHYELCRSCGARHVLDGQSLI
jgi:hypothetical protein